MKYGRLSLVVILALVLSFSIFGGVGEVALINAQDAAEDKSLDSEIKTLKQTYRGQLSEYRGLERVYQVSIEQHKKLNTLSSLEEAVGATQRTMQARSRVLLTYLELLRLTLLDTTGVPLDKKEDSLVQLDSVKAELLAHNQGLSGELDRLEIVKRAEEFALLGPKLQSRSYYILSLVRLAKLQTVHDKAQAIFTDLNALKTKESDSLKQAELNRALEETQRQLTAVGEQLTKLSSSIELKDDASNPQSVYSNLQRESEPLFADLSKLVSFLMELAKDQ